MYLKVFLSRQSMIATPMMYVCLERDPESGALVCIPRRWPLLNRAMHVS
jgi:hypothetical protein